MQRKTKTTYIQHMITFQDLRLSIHLIHNTCGIWLGIQHVLKRISICDFLPACLKHSHANLQTNLPARSLMSHLQTLARFGHSGACDFEIATSILRELRIKSFARQHIVAPPRLRWPLGARRQANLGSNHENFVKKYSLPCGVRFSTNPIMRFEGTENI